MRLALFYIISVFVCSQSFAQVDSSRANYALLWEITGNGLEKPSYLFGSMHIRDEFAFQFPDSLIQCLTNCDAFANEVQLDSAMLRLFEIYIGEQELNTDSSYIAFIKTKKVEVDSTFSLRKLDFNSILSSESSEDFSFDSEENQATMLDAFLMNVARELGKKTYGLEKIDNHLYESETSFDLSSGWSLLTSSKQDLERQYFLGDLAGIENIIQQEATAFDNLDLIPRNFIMVESMMKIMENESLFSVVGAAHLPGKDGVIDLLQKEGFILRKVTSNFSDKGKKILSRLSANNDRTAIIKKRPWPPIANKGARFNSSTPLPYLFTSVSPFESNYMQADIGRGLFYLLLTSSLTPYDYDDFDEYFFVDDGYEILKKSPFSLNGLLGKQYDLAKYGEDIEYFKGYVFIKNGELYYLQVGAYEEEALTKSNDPDVFINHFSIQESLPKKWKIIKDTIGGFQIQLPLHFITRNNDLEASRRNNRACTYSAGFEGSNSSVWLKYYDIPVLEQEESDSLEIAFILEEIEEHLGVDLEVDSVQNEQYLFSGTFLDKNLFVRGKVQLRGNRAYSLYEIDRKGFLTTKKFLKSFQILPFDREELYTKVSLMEHGQYECYLPEESLRDSIVNQRSLTNPIIWKKIITSMDNNSGAQHEVIIEKLHPLYGTLDTVAFLKNKALEYFNDSIVDQANITIKSANKGPKITIRTASENNRIEELREIVVIDNFVVSKTTYADPEYLSSPLCKQFFEEDQWIQKLEDNKGILVNKADTIIQLLTTQDSSCWSDIDQVLVTQIALNKIHVSLLQEQLPLMAWSQSEVAQSLQRKLIGAIANATGEQMTEVLGVVFETSNQGSYLRIQVLDKLLENKNNGLKEVQLFFELLMSDDILCFNAPDDLFKPFYEKPELFFEYKNFIQRALIANRDHPSFWKIASNAISYGLSSKEAVVSLLPEFIERGNSLLAGDETGRQPPTLFVLKLFQQFPENSKILEQIESLIEREQVDVVGVEALRFMLNGGNTISNRQIKRFLNESATWLPMIRLLNEYDLLHLVPRNRYNQRRIAEEMLLERLTLDGYVTTNLEYHDSMEQFYKGEKRLLYIFTFSLNEDPLRLGVVGFFSENGKERHFLDQSNIAYTDYLITKRRRTRKAKALVQDLISDD